MNTASNASSPPEAEENGGSGEYEIWNKALVSTAAACQTIEALLPVHY
ncbi:hypothetical protein [Paenibacillus sp. FSL R7-269]|nr:hypothetical protein [Paenibacillus sp. FSL R7-269]